jgi:SAM-dependent methyltransferase
VAEAVKFLAERAGTGPVLELGIGTGRVAVPLAAQGIEVHGIESSARMIDKLRDKPGAEAIRVVQGDMADVDSGADGYTLIFTTFNTFWMLLTQDDQVRCLCNAADRLADGGLVVIEGSLPDLATLGVRKSVDPFALTADGVSIDVTVRDALTQRIDRQHVTIDDHGVHIQPLAFRYVLPGELDLMARLAGLHPRERYATWSGAPVAQTSRGLIAVYERTS